MANIKFNTKILGIFFNGEILMPLDLGNSIGETRVPLPMILPLACAYRLARGFDKINFNVVC